VPQACGVAGFMGEDIPEIHLAGLSGAAPGEISIIENHVPFGELTTLGWSSKNAPDEGHCDNARLRNRAKRNLILVIGRIPDRAEIDKLRKELEATRAELQQLRNQAQTRVPAYLEELERLEALMAKGAITSIEFGNRKAVIIAAMDRTPPPGSAPTKTNTLTMGEMVEQFRNVHALYQRGTITSVDRDEAKKKLIARQLNVTNMAKDLELVGRLYEDGVITSLDRDELKKKLIASDAPIK